MILTRVLVNIDVLRVPNILFIAMMKVMGAHVEIMYDDLIPRGWTSGIRRQEQGSSGTRDRAACEKRAACYMLPLGPRHTNPGTSLLTLFQIN